MLTALLLTALAPVQLQATVADAAYKFVRCNWREVSEDGAVTEHQLSLNIQGSSTMARRIVGTDSRQTTLSDGTFFHSFTELSGDYVSTDSGMGHQFVTLKNGRVVDNAEGDVQVRGELQSLSLELVNANGERGFEYRLHNTFSNEQQFVSASQCSFNNLKLLK